ncbi:hypothetical protein BH24DEI2_BH24DEI2_01430 [soil metagenome]
MNDKGVLEHISELVEQEHALLDEGGSLDETKQQQLKAVQVELDQYWDLLRRRRAAEAYDEDPDEVKLRSEETVEDYRP